MAEYRYPKKVLLAWRIVVVTAIIPAVTGPVVCVLGYRRLLIPAFQSGLWASEGIFMLLFGALKLAIVSALFLVLLAAGRLIKSVYTADVSGIARMRGGRVVRVDFDRVLAVRYRRGALLLETDEGILRIPLSLVRGDELTDRVKDGVKAAGAAFPDKCYVRARQRAAEKEWEHKNPGKMVAVILAVIALQIYVGSQLGLILLETEDGGFAGALISVCLAAPFALFVSIFSASRFRGASQPGWRAPDARFTRRVLFLSAAATLLVFAMVAAAALYILT